MSEEMRTFGYLCPACGKTAVFEEDELLDGAPKCPNCGEPLDFEVTEE